MRLPSKLASANATLIGAVIAIPMKRSMVGIGSMNSNITMTPPMARYINWRGVKFPMIRLSYAVTFCGIRCVKGIWVNNLSINQQILNN